jgi:hypothetical protein
MRGLSPTLVSVVLVGCTTVPMAPSVAVYRMKGSTPEHDQADDARCREFAAAQLRTSPEREAMKSAAATTAALGAVSGALIGAGTGSAARGAVMGAGRERPQRDDHASTACMYASVHQVPGTPVR